MEDCEEFSQKIKITNLPNLPKQIIQLVSQFLTIEEIFLCFRFLKRDYHFKIMTLEKIIIQDKFNQMEICQAIQDSFSNIDELKQKIFNFQNKIEPIPFRAFYSDGGSQSNMLKYWCSNIFVNQIERDPICSLKAYDITILGGILAYENNNFQDLYYRSQQFHYAEFLNECDVELNQFKEEFKLNYMQKLLTEKFKFQEGLELQIPYEEPLQQSQAIIQEIFIDINYYYTCPLSCFGIFISNKNMIENIKKDSQMLEMGQLKDYYDLYIYIQKHQLKVEKTNIDFNKIEKELKENQNQKPFINLNLIEKNQNSIQEEQPQIENESNSQEEQNQETELQDNYYYCFFQINKNQEIHPLVWIQLKELKLDPLLKNFYIKIPQQCQIGSKYICLKMIDKFKTRFDDNIDITSLIPYGIHLKSQNIIESDDQSQFNNEE